jgi:hypothetical protein
MDTVPKLCSSAGRQYRFQNRAVVKAGNPRIGFDIPQFSRCWRVLSFNC